MHPKLLKIAGMSINLFYKSLYDRSFFARTSIGIRCSDGVVMAVEKVCLIDFFEPLNCRRSLLCPKCSWLDQTAEFLVLIPTLE
jgi:hypothetical protein